MAGVRTHAMVAIVAAVGATFGGAVLVAVVLAIGLLAVAAYLRTQHSDPGLTGEVAMLVTAMLAALAQDDPAIAGGLGVIAGPILTGAAIEGLRPWFPATRGYAALWLVQALVLLLAVPLVPREPPA